jgi:hypothetical protein
MDFLDVLANYFKNYSMNFTKYFLVYFLIGLSKLLKFELLRDTDYYSSIIYFIADFIF